MASLLAPLGLATADRGFLYRTLRSMDAERLVESSWDLSPVGPSRRMYRVTLTGEQWAVSASAGLRDADRIMATWAGRYRRVLRRGVETVAEVPAAG